ncbi:MAG: M20/M25/M40 family metallo-hydrolase [Oscillospiraceae bacterium]
MNYSDEEQVLATKIQGLSERYKDDQLSLLKSLTSVDCGTGNLVGNGEVVAILTKELEKLGADVKIIKAENVGQHIVAYIKPEKPTGKIIVNAHIDTVFEKGSVAKHPFTIKDDMAYGLGTADDKGGVVVILYGLKIALELGAKLSKEICIIFNCDEETGSDSAKEIFLQEGKGADYAMFFEPVVGENTVITKRQGVGRYSMAVTGVAAHSGIDFFKGRNAITELSHKICDVHSLTNIRPGITVNVGTVEGGTMVSTVPEYAHTEFCVRVNNAKEMELLREKISDIEHSTHIQGCKTAVNGRFTYYPMDRTDAILSIYNRAKDAAQLVGIDLCEEYANAGADVCHMNQFGVTAIDGFGPLQYNIHTFDEHVNIPSIVQKTNLFAAMLVTHRI